MDSVRQYPSWYTVVRPGPSARRDAKTQQIRQKGHAVLSVEYERNRASRGTLQKKRVIFFDSNNCNFFKHSKLVKFNQITLLNVNAQN